MSDLRSQKFAFLGSGIIAGVFIERLLKSGMSEPARILGTDSRAERLAELRERFGILTSGDNCEAARFGKVLFLAVPPGAVREVLLEVRGDIRADQLLVSLAAAVPTAAMESAIGKEIAVVRMIPNTPSLVGAGMNPHCLGKHVRPDQLPLIDQLLSTFGQTLRTEEALMNVATALTAVGPTYVFPVIKTLAEAAARHGMREDQARFAAAQTVLGAARMVLETGQTPDALKLMIGTRTLDETQAEAVFSCALDSAVEKISATERKLAQASATAL